MLVIDQVASVLAINLAEKGIAVPVVYGAEKHVRTQGGALVVVGLAPTFTGRPGEGPNFPGPAPTGDDSAARIVAVRDQNFRVWVRGEPPGPTVPAGQRVVEAQRITAELVHEVWDALWVAGPNVVRVLGGEWLDPDGADFAHGSRVRLDCAVLVPVLNDPRRILTGVRPGQTTTYRAMPDGSLAIVVQTPSVPPDP